MSLPLHLVHRFVFSSEDLVRVTHWSLSLLGSWNPRRFVALVALWPFVAFVGSLQLSCGEVTQPCERFRLPPTSAPIVEVWIDPVGVRFTGE